MNSLIKIILVISTFFSFVSNLNAEHPHVSENLWSPKKASSHAPIGVMGDHTHHKDEWMLSYRYMFMNMDGNRSANNRISTASVLNNYMVAPTSMNMEMHMFGAMYAPNSNLTLFGMLNFTEIEMEHVTRMGNRFKTNSNGVGDGKIGALYNIFDQKKQKLHLNFSVSLPTGDIEKRDNTSLMQNAILPYPMQIGSGTYDLNPGLTYLTQVDDLSFGAQVLGTIRLDDNSNDYTLGNELNVSSWISCDITNSISTSIRTLYRNIGKIDGGDVRLNPTMVQTADTNNFGGERVDLGFGLNFYKAKGTLSGLRFALEYLIPVYQNLSGIQLETDSSLILGAQLAF